MNVSQVQPAVEDDSKVTGVVQSQEFLVNLAACGIAIGFIVALWLIINACTRKTDDHDEMFNKRNKSYLVQRFSIVAAQAFAMNSTLGLKPANWSQLWWVAASGLLISVVVGAAYPIMRMVIGRNKPVPSVVTGGGDNVHDLKRSALDTDNDYDVKHSPRDPDKAVHDPLSIGLVVAGFYIAFGFVVNGVFDGDAPTRSLAYQSIAVFTLLGIAVPVAWYFINDVLTTRFFGYSIRYRVRQGQRTAGYEAAGLLIAMGIIMQAAISGDFTDWGNALQAFAVSAVILMFVTYAGRWLFDKVILPKDISLKDVHDEDNTEMALFLAGVLPIMALVMSSLAISFANLGA